MITMLSDYILVEEMEINEVTENGLVLVKNTKGKEPLKKGCVLAVGPGYIHETGEFIKNEIKEDDIVYYHHRFAWPITQNGKTYDITVSREVMCKLDDDEPEVLADDSDESDLLGDAPVQPPVNETDSDTNLGSDEF